MHFPVYPPLTLSTKMQRPEAWLAVPWAHIRHIRLASEVGEDGKCLAFDVLVASEEESRFFEAVGSPRDRQERLPTLVFAAYGGWPPSPVHAMAHLQRLSLRVQA